jgi:hypothetical protein
MPFSETFPRTKVGQENDAICRGQRVVAQFAKPFTTKATKAHEGKAGSGAFRK